jgi:hypothetical protein
MNGTKVPQKLDILIGEKNMYRNEQTKKHSRYSFFIIKHLLTNYTVAGTMLGDEEHRVFFSKDLVNRTGAQISK